MLTDDEKREPNAESLSDAVREAAQRAGEQRWPDSFVGQVAAKADFTDGAVWAAGRLPGRDEIARTMAITDDYDGCFERVESWKNASQEQRDCGEVEEPLSFDDEDCEVWLRRADAVLALIREHVTRG